jgi:hypothetical protein
MNKSRHPTKESWKDNLTRREAKQKARIMDYTPKITPSYHEIPQFVEGREPEKSRITEKKIGRPLGSRNKERKPAIQDCSICYKNKTYIGAITLKGWKAFCMDCIKIHLKEYNLEQEGLV